MRVFCISDTHGKLPTIPECDLFIHSGDVSNAWIDDKSFIQQFNFLCKDVTDWLSSIPARYKVMIPGNHDRILETKFTEVETVRRRFQMVGCNLLIDQEIVVDGLKIYGTPWQPFFHFWSFNEPEQYKNEEFLTEKFSQIPNDTDILLSHAPPYGYLDYSPDDGIHIGSKALLKRVEEIKPKLHVFGHCHHRNLPIETINDGKTILVNASYLDNNYKSNGSRYLLEI